MRFNISILEYFQFRFFELSDDQKASWAGTGTMYEFQRRANPPGQRNILDDKCLFHEAYRDFFRHDVATLSELEEDPELAARMRAAHSHLVFKPARGNCGIGIAFVETASLPDGQLSSWMRTHGYDLVEERVPQHADLQALSPSGVNTVRIFTALDNKDRCRIIGCRLRISVASAVDNLAAGNLAAPVDDATGRVSGPGVYSDITKPPEAVHPITGTAIEGFQVPFWQESLDLVERASLLHTENRSIGWDVVVTSEGPGLIEGNHDWCKLVWQLPIGRGLKSKLAETR